MTKLLSELKPGERATIIKVHGRGAIQHRIIDMGVVAGTKLAVRKFAPLGDPMEIKIKGFNLSLRKNEAQAIEVEMA